MTETSTGTHDAAGTANGEEEPTDGADAGTEGRTPTEQPETFDRE
jgi:hypothetical protein